MHYQLMEPHHARQVAEIHIKGQPGTFLTKLGHRFLTALYTEICHSPFGFGVVAIDGEQVIGVAVVSTSTSRLFADLRSRRALRLILPIVPQLFKHPTLVRDIWHMWRYPSKAGAADDHHATKHKQKVKAEFLFLGVRETHRRQRIGMFIFDRAIARAVVQGVHQISAVVDQKNERMDTGIMEHGEKYGIQGRDTVFLFGRPMHRVVMNVDQSFFSYLERHEAFEHEADWIPMAEGVEVLSSIRYATL
jgi:hypothetical protein